MRAVSFACVQARLMMNTSVRLFGKSGSGPMVRMRMVWSSALLTLATEDRRDFTSDAVELAHDQRLVEVMGDEEVRPGVGRVRVERGGVDRARPAQGLGIGRGG